MGYYSEVGLCLDKEAYTTFKAKLAKANEKLRQEVEGLIAYGTSKETEDEIFYYWQNIKWYWGYEDVDFIMNFIRDYRAETSNTEFYRFMRIGEDYGDIEVEGDYYDNPACLELSCSLTFVKEEKKDDENENKNNNENQTTNIKE